MKIYVLKEDNTNTLACVSEDIILIRKTICNRELFHPDTSYPVLTIWENGNMLDKVYGAETLKRIAQEIRENSK